jgi:hypothetical protein
MPFEPWRLTREQEQRQLTRARRRRGNWFVRKEFGAAGEAVEARES